MFKNKAQNLEFLNSYNINNVEVPKFIFLMSMNGIKTKKN